MENKYFQNFLQKTASGFDGQMDWPIWNSLVLQLSHVEPFIRDSVIAIGALCKALEIDVTQLEAIADNARLSDIAKMHREFALLKYGKAIKTMLDVLVSTNLREVLVACLLVYCFEVLLNNRHSALAHILSGHNLLRQWLNNLSQPRPGSHYLLSPDPITIDNELVDIFNCLDLQTMTIYDTRPVSFHVAVVRETVPLVKQMPHLFSDLLEARRYLIAVMRRSYHFLATTWHSSRAGAFARNFHTLSPNNVVVTTGTNIYSTPFYFPCTMYSAQIEFAEEISGWSRAFQQLYYKTRQLEVVGLENYVAGSILRIHAITITIVVAGVLFTEETSYDTFLPQFKELLALTTIIADEHRKKSDRIIAGERFFLDLGVTSPLYFLIAHCRDHSVRVQAIALLKGWHTESCWQPRLVAGIGEFLMDVEEEGNVAAIIPETSRAVITAVCDRPDRDNKRMALVQCVQRYRGQERDLVWNERKVFY